MTLKPIIVATNINDLPWKTSDKRYAAKDGEISIGVLPTDIEKDYPTFYAFRDGYVYDPRKEFKPDKSGGHTLPEHLITEYWKMKNEAEQNWHLFRNVYLKNASNGGGNTAELEELKNELSYKTNIIQKQAKQISDLSQSQNNGGGNNSGQIEKLEKMVQALSEIQSKRIEIKMPGKATKVIEDKILHAKFSKILGLILSGFFVYLHGPAGTGKSETAKQLADVMELDFYPASTVTQEFKLTGYKDGNGLYHDTNFYKAFKYGGLFFLDELDSCSEDVLVGINGALSNKYFDFPGGTVTAHPNFKCIAAGNTIGRGADEMYTGRNVLDASTIDRFLAVPYSYDPAIDKHVARDDMELVEFAHALRKAAQESGIQILMSYRAIGNVAKLVNDLDFDLVEAMEIAVIKGIATDDVVMLCRNMELSSSNKYLKAFKAAA